MRRRSNSLLLSWCLRMPCKSFCQRGGISTLKRCTRILPFWCYICNMVFALRTRGRRGRSYLRFVDASWGKLLLKTTTCRHCIDMARRRRGGVRCIPGIHAARLVDSIAQRYMRLCLCFRRIRRTVFPQGTSHAAPPNRLGRHARHAAATRGQCCCLFERGSEGTAAWSAACHVRWRAWRPRTLWCWRAIFPHLNCQKWWKHAVFCTFWLANVLRATAACKFSCVLSTATSAPAALPSLLFDPADTQIIEKTQRFVTFLTFRACWSSFYWLSRMCIFFWLCYSTLLFQLSILSEVRLLNFLRSSLCSVLSVLSGSSSSSSSSSWWEYASTG